MKEDEVERLNRKVAALTDGLSTFVWDYHQHHHQDVGGGIAPDYLSCVEMPCLYLNLYVFPKLKD